MTDNQFIRAVILEVANAREKFPSNDGLTLALAEESGEAIKAAMDENLDFLRAECVQTAAMALRLAVEGDPMVDALRKGRES